MKKNITTLSAIFMLSIAFAQPKGYLESLVEPKVDAMLKDMATKNEIVSPRTITKDATGTQYVPLEEWTSGFFPGSLWYLYELTGKDKWKDEAVKYTEGMERIKHYTGNHDIGFMIFCSFGNGLRLTNKQEYNDIIVTAANTLMKRFRLSAGVIQSWNKQRNWECPVIIDNMMNLELLFEATKISGDSTFWYVAISHADNTIQNQYRDDYSCCHVVDYDPENGVVRGKYTAQGYSDDSAWARGQAWGLYGYTLCYRYTKDAKYLAQAENIAKFILEHKNLPEDMIPYWDFDAVNPPSEGKYNKLKENPRDASAASIIASALYELSTYSKKGKDYVKAADKIVKSLVSDEYTARNGVNGNFVLKHSTGSIPHGVEIDAPLVYADYYLLEAFKRKRDLK